MAQLFDLHYTYCESELAAHGQWRAADRTATLAWWPTNPAN